MDWSVIVKTSTILAGEKAVWTDQGVIPYTEERRKVLCTESAQGLSTLSFCGRDLSVVAVISRLKKGRRKDARRGAFLSVTAWKKRLSSYDREITATAKRKRTQIAGKKRQKGVTERKSR